MSLEARLHGQEWQYCRSTTSTSQPKERDRRRSEEMTGQEEGKKVKETEGTIGIYRATGFAHIS